MLHVPRAVTHFTQSFSFLINQRFLTQQFEMTANMFFFNESTGSRYEASQGYPTLLPFSSNLVQRSFANHKYLSQIMEHVGTAILPGVRQSCISLANRKIMTTALMTVMVPPPRVFILKSSSVFGQASNRLSVSRKPWVILQYV